MFNWLKRLFSKESPISILDEDTLTTRRQVSRGIYTPPRTPSDYKTTAPVYTPSPPIQQNPSMDLLNPLNPLSPISPFSIYNEPDKPCDPPSHDHSSSFDSSGSCSSDSSSFGGGESGGGGTSGSYD